MWFFGLFNMVTSWLPVNYNVLSSKKTTGTAPSQWIWEINAPSFLNSVKSMAFHFICRILWRKDAFWNLISIPRIPETPFYYTLLINDNSGISSCWIAGSCKFILTTVRRWEHRKLASSVWWIWRLIWWLLRKSWSSCAAPMMAKPSNSLSWDLTNLCTAIKCSATTVKWSNSSWIPIPLRWIKC